MNTCILMHKCIQLIRRRQHSSTIRTVKSGHFVGVVGCVLFISLEDETKPECQHPAVPPQGRCFIPALRPRAHAVTPDGCHSSESPGPNADVTAVRWRGPL